MDGRCGYSRPEVPATDSRADVSPNDSRSRSRRAKLGDDESSLAQLPGTRYVDCTLELT